MSDPTTCDCVKRDDAQSLAADGWPFHRILIATDGSHTGARALQTIVIENLAAIPIVFRGAGPNLSQLQT